MFKKLTVNNYVTNVHVFEDARTVAYPLILNFIVVVNQRTNVHEAARKRELVLYLARSIVYL